MENFLEFFAWEPTSPIFWAKVIFGFFVGILLNIIAFMLLTPLFIGYLINRSEGTDPDEKSGFHLFTFIEEGKAKIIVKGDLIDRMIMVFADHSFARVGSRDSAKYWQIKRKPGNAEDPLEDVYWLFRPWARYVYAVTGAVFTGIYPFQRVREYTLERTKVHRNEKTTSEDISDSDKGLQGSNIFLEVEEDISDHLRVQQFIYPIRIPAADTQDKVSVNILAVLKARVTNPHKAAFATPRWDHQLVNLATDAVNNYTRISPLDLVLSAKDDNGAKGLNRAILSIKEDERKYGIEIEGVDILDISPNLPEDEKKLLHAEALAKPVGKATVIDGDSRAQVLRKINNANKAGGAFAIETLRSEALVRAAGAAKAGTVILPAGGTQNDPMSVALLAELRKEKEGADAK